MKNKVLIIKYNQAGFEEYYSKKLKELKCDILNVHELSNLSESCGICDFNMGHSVRRYFQKHNLQDYKMIIVFDAVYLIPAIDYVTSSKCKIILWMWNTIEEYNIKRLYLAKEFAEVWTFDKGDAQKYGLHFSEQFYFAPSDMASTITNKTVFFVGADKDRMKTICKLSTELTKIGYISDFHVLPDSDRKYKHDEQVFLLKERMDYFQVIDHVKNCSVVLDLVKEGQVGLTVRTLEAAFYGKKVITNNKAARYYDLYKFGNIYILEEENYKLENFLIAPFKEYPKEVLSEYTAQRWLDNLSSGKESELDIYGDVRHTDSKQASKQASRYTFVAA